MNRGEIRDYARMLADELTEAPEGLFTNTQLNLLINIAQQKVYTKLILAVPWYFRTGKLISTTANKRVYSIATDLSISDFFLFHTILRNDGSRNPAPLFKIEPSDRWQYEKTPTETGIVKAWGYEDRSNIFLSPCPAATEANIFNGYYFKVIPDLNHDSSDVAPNVATPHLPISAHSLISYEVLKLWHVRGEEEKTDIQQLYDDALAEAISALTIRTEFEGGQLPDPKEMI